MIAWNNNTYLRWTRHDCYSYTVENISGGLLSFLIEGEGWDGQEELAAGDTYSFTLPGDGVFEVTVTVLEEIGGEPVNEVISGKLVEFCALYLCYLKLLTALYCTDCNDKVGIAGVIDDPCAAKCKQLGLSTKNTVQDPERLRNALMQLEGMFTAYVLHVLEYNMGYLPIDVPLSARESKGAIILGMWEKIKKFTESCGFDCQEGSSASYTGCKNC